MNSSEAYIGFQQRRIDMITQSELQIIKQATYSKDQIRPNVIKERQGTFWNTQPTQIILWKITFKLISVCFVRTV